MATVDSQRFHEPLRAGDSETTTFGCRRTNPDICVRHSLTRVCAFVRADGICTAPPATWPKRYRSLRVLADGGAE